jgi:hypothetical protein
MIHATLRNTHNSNAHRKLQSQNLFIEKTKGASFETLFSTSKNRLFSLPSKDLWIPASVGG